MTNYYEYERKIESMIDEMQGLCSQQGLSNTASEEEVVTTVFLYKFLNDKFMYNLNKFGEDIGDKIGQEVKMLIDTAYNDAQILLKQHRDKLDMIAETLLQKEKINEEDFKKFFE